LRSVYVFVDGGAQGEQLIDGIRKTIQENRMMISMAAGEIEGVSRENSKRRRARVAWRCVALISLPDLELSRDTCYKFVRDPDTSVVWGGVCLGGVVQVQGAK